MSARSVRLAPKKMKETIGKYLNIYIYIYILKEDLKPQLNKKKIDQDTEKCQMGREQQIKSEKRSYSSEFYFMCSHSNTRNDCREN